VAGLFDEIVVVDTGSTDRTAEIAREFGARVFDFVWVDDCAAARNAALARAKGDYAFWLDADDVIDPPQRQRFRELIAGLNALGVCSEGLSFDPGDVELLFRKAWCTGPPGSRRRQSPAGGRSRRSSDPNSFAA
jgi:glycosyltransferase involved in cell wall biosynthesis